MGWQCCFLFVVSALVASHASKVVFWYEGSCRRRAKKNIFRFYRSCIDILVYLAVYFLGIPNNFGHFAGIGEKERGIGAVYDISAFMAWGYRVLKSCRLYQNILFLGFVCWRASEDDRGGCS
jgi:hypothetical protein